MSQLSSTDKIQPHWWLKSIAGTLLGLTLAYGIVTIYVWYGPGTFSTTAKTQFNMWIISPLWLLILSFSFMFKTAKQAFIYLSAANIITYGSFALLRWLV